MLGKFEKLIRNLSRGRLTMAAIPPVCNFGEPASDFELPATDGRRYRLALAISGMFALYLGAVFRGPHLPRLLMHTAPRVEVGLPSHPSRRPTGVGLGRVGGLGTDDPSQAA